MTCPLRIQTGVRLHFGLLSWDPQGQRQCGGLGLMVEQPGLAIRAHSSDEWSAAGPLAERVLRDAKEIATRAAQLGWNLKPLAFEVESAPTEHEGLGSGTQVGLCVARLIAESAGIVDVSLRSLARLSGRGLRSGIGIHGFERGGLLVDGGRSLASDHFEIPSLVSAVDFPADWSILIVRPMSRPGLAGTEERLAFERIGAMPRSTTERLCRLVLLEALPAVVERDLERFGQAIEAIQHDVGSFFSSAQGGTIYAGPEVAEAAQLLRDLGMKGVGQSSWGPSVYGFLPADAPRQHSITAEILARLQIDPSRIIWTTSRPRGATIQRLDDLGRTDEICHSR